MAFIDLIDCSKIYQTGETQIIANDKISFSVNQGEFVIIVGPSGAGKSTTLNLLGGMDRPSSGEIIVDGAHLENYSDRDLTRYRREVIGFVFQFYNLVPNLTALENVELAAQLVDQPDKAEDVLAAVGLSDRAGNFPAQLSGGEQQRVAIARALVKKPRLLLADEPTGALDYQTGREVLGLLHNACRVTGTTVLVITHNQALTPLADRVISIVDAKVREVRLNPNPLAIEDVEW
ncbi:ABC transporter ATP-binding protein [Peptococcus simiae]|uniref:ABC transporter ATP-binding protein n=1 Tax=Peptococcus simiae TaxID=1643805 RepID=A0ABW9GYD1_9FIRM